MHSTVENLLKIQTKVKLKFENKNKDLNSTPKIIAVSKTFGMENIKPLINNGHIDFGENKVQEAEEKWAFIKKQNKSIKLHLIGKLQTNKVKAAVKLFDYIHSLDNKKLADKIQQQENDNNLKTKIFIQVNIGSEEQKSGISVDEIPDFYNYCKSINLNIIGLMCIPPINSDIERYFQNMKQLNQELNLKELSMGMSADYLTAVEYGATYLRIGSNIFGARN